MTIKPNQPFGRLIAKILVGRTKRGQEIWRCKCVCGNTKEIRGYHLKGGKIRSCGCLTRETANIKWVGYGEVGGWLWNSYQLGARVRKLLFTLTIQDMWEVFLGQNGKCALTGETLVLPKRQTRRKEGNASLDRIDSSKGYIRDNVQWVTKEVNLAKRDMSQNDFLVLCRKVSQHQGCL